MATTKKSIKGTQTEKNIVNAYVAESTAYTRYLYYAKQADKDKYPPIGKAFRETAENEFEHSKVFFKMLEGGSVKCEMAIDAGVIGDTLDNLKTAAKEERYEGVEQYLEAAKVAEKEGFPEIALHFKSIAAIEEKHMKRFECYIKQIETDTVWKRDHEIIWKCLECGYEHKGKTPPTECPACDHAYQYYVALDM
ncbi:MAG: rubrerythrin family protein [Muribaculaceae bacterium]|nr:rubrerythrin family protein [Muribaculaceae bacterium]